jgi:hypothetical protein
MNGNGEDTEMMMDCLVIGGVADGVRMRILFGAETVELGQPTHAKVIDKPDFEADIEFEKKKDVYNILTLHLPTATGQVYPFALAIVDGHDPMWAAKQIMTAYVMQSTELRRRKEEAEANDNVEVITP